MTFLKMGELAQMSSLWGWKVVVASPPTTTAIVGPLMLAQLVHSVSVDCSVVLEG
jgi:hypothetical protein